MKFLLCLFIDFRVLIGLEDVLIYFKLVEEFFWWGYSNVEVSKIVGGNLIIVMEKMEKVSKSKFIKEFVSYFLYYNCYFEFFWVNWFLKYFFYVKLNCLCEDYKRWVYLNIVFKGNF